MTNIRKIKAVTDHMNFEVLLQYIHEGYLILENKNLLQILD